MRKCIHTVIFCTHSYMQVNLLLKHVPIHVCTTTYLSLHTCTHRWHANTRSNDESVLLGESWPRPEPLSVQRARSSAASWRTGHIGRAGGGRSHAILRPDSGRTWRRRVCVNVYGICLYACSKSRACSPPHLGSGCSEVNGHVASFNLFSRTKTLIKAFIVKYTQCFHNYTTVGSVIHAYE